MMVEKIQQIDGEKLGYNKMMVKIYVQQNDGGILGSTKWWWKIMFNKMMVEK